MLNYNGVYMELEVTSTSVPNEFLVIKLTFLINLECTGHKLHKSSELHTWLAVPLKTRCTVQEMAIQSS